ncbi:unnamed protein product [Parajaminaea phylloscopi]
MADSQGPNAPSQQSQAAPPLAASKGDIGDAPSAAAPTATTDTDAKMRSSDVDGAKEELTPKEYSADDHHHHEGDVNAQSGFGGRGQEGTAFTDEELHLTPQAAKSILWKVDVAIVPYASLLYLLSFLDRVNIGQANVAGLSTALHLKGNEYAVALSVFFVSYVAFEIPFNWLAKLWKPHRFVPAIMFSWSIVMILMGIVHNAAGLQAARFFLGLTESGLFPSLNFLMTNWYPRSKQNLRIGLFFAGATLAGAFGGVLAYGLKHIQAGAYDTPVQGWRWIFIIEGLLTFVAAIPAYWIIVDFPGDKQKFLTKQEEGQWIRHLQESQGLTNAQIPFSWSQITSAFADWKIWCYSIMYLSIANPLYSLALFTPQIISDLQFSGASANLLSVPPYVLGFITTVLAAILSDRYLVRSVPIVITMGVVAIGYIILLCHVSAGVRYFALFLCVAGSSPAIALAISFVGANYGPVYRRGTAMGLFFMFGNSAGLVSSNVYPKKEAPRYVKGHAINLAFSALAILCAITLAIANRRINAQRDKIHPASLDGRDVQASKLGEPAEKKKWGLEHLSTKEIVELGDRHPAFRLVW